MAQPAADSSKNKVIINGNVLLYEAKAPYVKSGHSLKGVLEYDPDEDKVMCHECGKWFRNLAVHSVQAHGVHADEYKRRHGLKPSSALVNERLRLQRTVTARKYYWECVARGLKRGAVRKRSSPSKRLSANGGSAEFQNARRICPTQLLERLKECAKAVGHTPTVNELKEHGLSYTTIRHRFGSMKEAVTLADLGYRQQPQAMYSRRFLIALIRNFVATYGRLPAKSDCGRGLSPSAQPFKNTFGSWGKAIAAAGFVPPARGRGQLKRNGNHQHSARKPIPIQKASPKNHRKAAAAHA